LETEVTKLNNKVMNLDNKVMNLDKKVMNLENTQKDMVVRLTKLENTQKDVVVRLTKLEDAHTAVSCRLATAENRMANMDDKRDGCREADLKKIQQDFDRAVENRMVGNLENPPSYHVILSDPLPAYSD
jgi:phage shock protein A